MTENAATNILETIRLRLAGVNRLDLMPQSCSIPNQSKNPPPIHGNPANDFHGQQRPLIPQILEQATNAPPVVVADREGDAFHSLHIGRKTKISFHRTLRVPEDGHDYPLPAGLGAFPIHRVEDYADTVPPQWLEEGGFFIPLYQREALFIQFEGEEWCPAIAKVCVGQINAITGKPYSEKLSPHSQDYVVIPKQKWLDGINSGDGTVKQFVAMPLGQGYTIESQITDEEKYGGFQLVVYEPVDGRFKEPEPSISQKINFLNRISRADFETMLKSINKLQKAIIDSIRNEETAADAAIKTGLSKKEVVEFYNNFIKSFMAVVAANTKRHFYNDKDYQVILARNFMILMRLNLREDIDPVSVASPIKPDKADTDAIDSDSILYSSPAPSGTALFSSPAPDHRLFSSPAPERPCQEVKERGIAAGGKIKQQIFQDTYGAESWDLNQRRLLKIHMVNSIAYQSITGQEPPPSPITTEKYQESRIPWFSHYDENTQSLKGASAFGKLIGIEAIDKRRGIADARPLSNITIDPEVIRKIKTPDVDEAIQDFRKRSRENADAGRWAAALREIDYLIDLESDDESGVEAQDYALRSLCNYQIKRYFEGMLDGDKALKLDSNCTVALSSRAFCRLLMGDFHGVKEDAKKLLQNPQTELIGLELRAEACLLSGHYNDAIYDALSLGKKRPGYRRAEEILDEARSKANQLFEEKRSK